MNKAAENSNRKLYGTGGGVCHADAVGDDKQRGHSSRFCHILGMGKNIVVILSNAVC